MAERPADEPGLNPDSGETHPVPLLFPVIGVGASAGGLEAFTQLLSHLPEKPGLALVYIQHLDPDHSSHLPQILSRVSKLAVKEAADGLAVERDSVYTIPPGTTLTLRHGRFKLSPREKGLHLPVDIFFRSLAEEANGKAIGVILSGTGSDGTLGLAEIKAAGGITFAQEGESAKYSGMPKRAVEEGAADFILTPVEIARELVGLGAHPYFSAHGPEGGPQVGSEEDYQSILKALLTASGVDFRHYRDTTLKRRILRRMALHKMVVAPAYLEKLRADQNEVQALYQDVLINVTRFFRNPFVFDALKNSVFPEIARQKAPGVPIRIWSAGCSSGEEAFSLAMALVEFQDSQQNRHPIRIFASDISETPALDKARLGLYPDSIEGDVSKERLARFFSREGNAYRINPEIREMCVFARHNLVSDPPFSRMDLITCRNLLIYLSPHLQRKVLSTLHYAMNPSGFLMLGTSETVGRDAELFHEVDLRARIYGKKAAVNRTYPVFTVPEFTPRQTGAVRAAVTSPVPVDFEKAADRILLRRFSPAGILVNRDLDILQFRGRTSPYLEPPQGMAQFKLVKMAAETLFLEIRNAVREADQKQRTVRREGVKVRHGGLISEVGLEIIPVRPMETGDGCFLVLFEEPGDSARPSPAPMDAPGAGAGEAEHLRLELAAAREYLKSIREQYDSITEELTSTNEELLSSNEELQSTNEELETAKEELQSTNEELTTLNEELRIRNFELGQANNDLNNLLASIDMPIVMLGGDVRIRRFTPAAGATLRLTPADIGRHLNDLNTGIGADDLEQVVRKVIETMTPIIRDIRDRDQRWHALKIHPYRNAENRVDGAVLILLDIDLAKQAHRDLALCKFICDQQLLPHYLLRRDGGIHYLNQAAAARLGLEGEATTGLRYPEIDPSWPDDKFQGMFDGAFAGKAAPFATFHNAGNGKRIPVECTVSGFEFEGERFLLLVAHGLPEA